MLLFKSKVPRFATFLVCIAVQFCQNLKEKRDYFMSENSEKTDKKKEPLVFENVKVYIESRGKTYEYFMTDDIDVLFRKLNSLGYRNVKESDWRLNSSLAKSVRNKMTELGCRFSMTFSHGTSVLNFWAKNSTRPYLVNLDELLPLDSVLKRQMSRIKESITGTENFKKLAERNSWTPLMMAVMMNSQESVKEYIAEGFDVNCSDKDGITPLMIAVSNRNKEMVELLIKNGADVNYCTNRGT